MSPRNADSKIKCQPLCPYNSWPMLRIFHFIQTLSHFPYHLPMFPCIFEPLHGPPDSTPPKSPISPLPYPPHLLRRSRLLYNPFSVNHSPAISKSQLLFHGKLRFLRFGHLFCGEVQSCKGDFSGRRGSGVGQAYQGGGAHAGGALLLRGEFSVAAHGAEIFGSRCGRGPGNGQRVRHVPDEEAEFCRDCGGHGGSVHEGELLGETGVGREDEAAGGVGEGLPDHAVSGGGERGGDEAEFRGYRGVFDAGVQAQVVNVQVEEAIAGDHR